jgi:regulator of sirC expression with transglutaminase-like and TPR domain
MGGLRNDFAGLMRAGEHADLARCAATIARIAYPALDVDRCVAALDALAVGARPHLTRDIGPAAAASAIAAWLYGPAGFRGNTEDYYDPRNSFLNDVLERRTGIPITLGVVFIETAARLGLRLEGVGFPGHFLVRVPGTSRAMLLDPFDRGRLLEEAELLERYRAVGARNAGAVPTDALAPTTTPGILTRMLRNLLRVWVDREDYTHALEAIDLILVVTPDAPDDVRLRGLIYEQLECYSAAAADLRRYVTLVPRAADAQQVRARIAELARRGPTLH